MSDQQGQQPPQNPNDTSTKGSSDAAIPVLKDPAAQAAPTPPATSTKPKKQHKEPQKNQPKAPQKNPPNNNAKTTAGAPAPSASPTTGTSQNVTSKTPQKNPANKPAVKSNQQNKAQNKQPSSIPLLTGIAALIIAIAGAATGAYNWNQQQQSNLRNQARIAELNNQLRAQQLSLASLGNVQTTVVQLGTVITGLNSRQGQLSLQVGQLGADLGQLGVQSGRVDQLETNLNTFTGKLETTLAQIAGRVNEISTSSRTDWQIAEVEYFLRIATDSLMLEGNTKTAQSLLEAADRLVQEIDDVGLIQLRQSIADDLVAIKAIRVPDYQGMAFTLNALSKQVSNLRMPLQLTRTQTSSAASANRDAAPIQQVNDQPNKQANPSWMQRLETKLASLAQQLKGLVTIRRINQPVEPLMPPEQQIYLAQNLHLLLEQAQLALLRKNQALYQQSMDKALNWVQSYYNPEDAASISFTQHLTELKAIPISFELPDISGSLRTFKQFQQQRVQLEHQTAQTQPAKLEVNLR